MAHFIATTEKMSAEELAKLFRDYVWKLHRLPESIILDRGCQGTKLHAGIKPTALCSAFDKENSIEFPLDSLHYLYHYYMVCVPLSHTYHVTSCDVML